MQDTASLNCHYLEYSAGRLEKKKFEGIIFEVLHENKFRLAGFCREDYDDFVSSLYPRISRAIDSYSAIGSSFGAYVNKIIRMSAKEYLRQQLRRRNLEIAAWTTQIPDTYAYETEDDEPQHSEVADPWTLYEQDDMGLPWNIRNSRQLLILILKCCRYVSNDFIERISPRLGVPPGVLSDMILRLKECREKREAQTDTLRELTNHYFCRCLFYERTLWLASEDPLAARRIKARLERYRIKLGKARERLARSYLDPSNAQIAEILGLTKGTVDAAMFRLKSVRRDEAEDRHLLN